MRALAVLATLLAGLSQREAAPFRNASEPTEERWPSVTGVKSCSSADPVAEQRVDECLGLERRQVVRPLAEANQLDRDTEVALYGDDDAAFSRTVQLCEDDPGDVNDLGEHARLSQPV